MRCVRGPPRHTASMHCINAAEYWNAPLDDHDEFLDCCNYTNFRPLLEKDKLIKSSKWSDDDNKFWLQNIKGKKYLFDIVKNIC